MFNKRELKKEKKEKKKGKKKVNIQPGSKIKHLF